MSKKEKTIRPDGSVVMITTTEHGEYICSGYDAENDITKSHEEIVCKVAEIDLEIDELIRNTE